MMMLSIMMMAVLLSGCEGQVIDRKEVLVKDDAGIKVTLLKDRTHTSGNELYVVLDIEDTKPGSKIVTAGLFDNANHTAKVNGVDIPVQSYTITTGMPGSGYAERTWITVKIDDLEAEMMANASSYGQLSDLTKEKEETEALLEQKMERWEYLTELAEKIEAQKS